MTNGWSTIEFFQANFFRVRGRSLPRARQLQRVTAFAVVMFLTLAIRFAIAI